MSIRQLSTTLILVDLIFILFSSNSLGMAKPRNPTVLMGVMGDSISAGTFAETKDSPFPILDFFHIPDGFLESKDTFSWASGEDIRSHYKRLRFLKRQHGVEVEVVNAAVPGSLISDLKAQARKIRKLMRSGDYVSLEYVTIMIGSNDACRAVSKIYDSRYWKYQKERLWIALQVLSSIKQEKIKILLSALPDIPSLGKDSISRKRTVGALTCRDFRNTVLKLCNDLLGWQTERGYYSKRVVVEEHNKMLAEFAQTAERDFPNLEIFFTDKLFELKITSADLAMDCFHPSLKGQQKISDVLWLEQPFF